MIRRITTISFELILLGATLPAFGAEPTAPAHVTTTERVNFAPGGTIRVDRSYGDLRVEGWDRPEVEVTVTKSMPFDYKRKHPEKGPQHLEGVHIVTEHSSNTELTISTTLPSRPFHLGPTSRSVSAEYEIHVPRESKLVIHHGTGSVFVSDISGDIEATCGRGDIMLMLRDSDTYTIDALNKFGIVTSDFDGTPRLRPYRVGERYATSNSTPAPRIYLRIGFGGITIKAIPPEAYLTQNLK